MTHVLPVPALEIRDPVSFLVSMEADDRALGRFGFVVVCRAGARIVG